MKSIAPISNEKLVRLSHIRDEIKITFYKGRLMGREEYRLPKKGVNIERGFLQRYVDKLNTKLSKQRHTKWPIDKRYRVHLCVYAKPKEILGKGDLDNYCKAVLDIITKTERIWGDDKQVDEIYIQRIWSKKNPHLTIEIKTIK